MINNYVGTGSPFRHDEEVTQFIETLSIEGHTLVSISTITHNSDLSRLRTEIVYREVITRKVIVEKTDN